MKRYLWIALSIYTLCIVTGCGGHIGNGGSTIPGSPQSGSISKSVSAVSSMTGVPKVTVSPTTLHLATYAGSVSAPAHVTLSNTGTAALSISKIVAASCSTFSYCFGQTNNCGGGLAAGTNCTINVTFSSRVTGSFKGTLSVYDNATGSPQTVSLFGTAACVGLGQQCYSARKCCPGLVCVPASTRAFCEPSWARVGQSYLNQMDVHRAYMDRLATTDFISVVDTKRRIIVRTIPVSAGTSSLAITSDGKKLYVANAVTDSVSIIDTQRHAVGKTIAVGFSDRPTDVAVAASGRFAYVSNAQENGFSVIDTTTDAVVKTVPRGPLPASIAILRRCSPGIVSSPDGSTAYVVTDKDGIVPVESSSDSISDFIALAASAGRSNGV